MRSWIRLLVVAATSFTLFLPSSIRDVTPFDEGFIVTGALLVARGHTWVSDFYSTYGPGQYYLTAALFKIFGEDLLVAHLLHALTLSALAVAIYALACAAAPRRRAVAAFLTLAFVAVVLFAKPSVGYPALSSVLFLLLGAAAFASWSACQHPHQLWITSLFMGIAGLFRWDFGLFGIAAVSTSALMAPTSERQIIGVAARRLVSASLPGVTLIATVYTVLLVPAYFDRWYDEVPRFLITEFRDWRNLRFIAPAYWKLRESIETANVLDFYDAAIRLAFAVWAPTIVVLGGVIGTWQLWRNRAADKSAVSQTVFLSIVGLLLLNQMRVRPSLWQGFSAFACSLPITAYLLGLCPAILLRRIPLRVIANATFCIVAAVLGTVGFRELLRSLPMQSSSFTLPRASYIRLPRELEQYGELIRFLREHTPAGQPIYSGVTDNSRLFVNDALVYFLADRPPAVRFVEMEPGIANTINGQREILEALEHKNVETIVLWEVTSDEPNRTAFSNGVHILDEYVRAQFREVRRFGAYSVLSRVELIDNGGRL